MSSPIENFDSLTLDPNMKGAKTRGGRRRRASPRQEDHSSPSSGAVSPQATHVSGSSGPVAPTSTFQAPHTRRYIERQVPDILSTFEKDILPSGFRPDEQATISTVRSPRQCLVPMDLQATVLRLAVNTPAFFTALQEAQPPGSCAQIFFDKVLQIRIRPIINDWTRFCVYGPTGLQVRDPSASVSSSAPTRSQRGRTIDSMSSTASARTKDRGNWMNMEDVIIELRSMTSLLRREILSRRPYGGPTAANCIMYILREVIIRRNRDAFAEQTWNRIPSPGETDEDRNLYWQTIVAPYISLSTAASAPSRAPRSTSQYEKGPYEDDQDDETMFFGLPALEALPRQVLVEQGAELRQLQAALVEANAPTAYVGRLQSILEGSSLSASSPASGKKRERPAEEAEEGQGAGAEAEEGRESRGAPKAGARGSGSASSGGGKRGRST